MEKRDYKKILKHLYKASPKKPAIIDVPEMNFLMIDGEGSPGETKTYQDAVQALYVLSYTLKFMVKKGGMEIDYGVMPLEGLWWADDMTAFIENRRDEWKWTMMIMQPEIITAEMVEEARAQAIEKKGFPTLKELRFEAFEEGKVGQILHIGPFSEEGPTIQGLHQFIEDEGFQLRAKHHEIYLTDIRRAAPERWKTIIRQGAG